MMCKSHLVGILYNQAGAREVTFRDLREHVKMLEDIVEEFREISRLKRKITHYTMKDYTDRKKETNLSRFNFCPVCGEKIDWAMLDGGAEDG